MFDVHPFFEQPFFQVICLFLHVSFYSRFDVGRSMFILSSSSLSQDDTFASSSFFPFKI